MCGHVCVSAGTPRGQMLRMPAVVVGSCELPKVGSGIEYGPFAPTVRS